MGSYTDSQKFYLIDPSELVNVESDINYNFRRMDTRLRNLVDYKVTDVSNITNSTLEKEVGYKWYKTASNSIWNWHKRASTNTSEPFQDPNAVVQTWSSSVGTFVTGYGSLNQESDRIGYSIFNGWVQWRGKLVLNGGASELPLNVGTSFLTPPTNLMPNRTRYFLCSGGYSVVGDYQIARIVVPSPTDSVTRMSFTRWGSNGGNNLNRFINLNDLRYPLNDGV